MSKLFRVCFHFLRLLLRRLLKGKRFSPLCPILLTKCKLLTVSLFVCCDECELAPARPPAEIQLVNCIGSFYLEGIHIFIRIRISFTPEMSATFCKSPLGARFWKMTAISRLRDTWTFFPCLFPRCVSLLLLTHPTFPTGTHISVMRGLVGKAVGSGALIWPLTYWGNYYSWDCASFRGCAIIFTRCIHAAIKCRIINSYLLMLGYRSAT